MPCPLPLTPPPFPPFVCRYRAPECLLTDGYYGPEMDLWGAGCVFFEITSLYPLFPGTNEIDQVARIHKVRQRREGGGEGARIGSG